MMEQRNPSSQRARIVKHYKDRYGVDVDEEGVMVTTGSSAAFVLGFIAAFGPGDRVAIASPGYPCYRNILESLGIEVVSVPVDATTNFQPTVELLDAVLLEDSRPLKGLIVASPSNPTGTVLKTSELFALHAWCKERGVWFISDEIYHQIEYGKELSHELQPPKVISVISVFFYLSVIYQHSLEYVRASEDRTPTTQATSERPRLWNHPARRRAR